ncbi:MAG: hypothetical protein MSC31_04895 [Solirubrobacteraceae bacterium MAG38_C4-C5]|nr:hypothetical protein [Candidatus Siliceabacter maunaloa]
MDRGADSGVTFHSAAAAGRRLVWTEERRWRGRVRAVLVAARATDGSVFRRTELARNETGFGLRELDAVVTPGGTVATFVRVSAGDDSAGQRLVLYRGGEEVREVTRGNLAYLGLEDGRTLRWTDGADRVYRDLNPPTRNNAGCPRRERSSAF